MLIAEWSGTRVIIRDDHRIKIRQIDVRHPVVGVQISGDSTTEATVAIAQSHGRTDIYKSSGQLIRRG